MATTQIRGSTQIIGLSIADAQIAAAAAIATTKLADGALFIKSDGTVAMGATLNLGSHYIQNLLDPVNPQDAATRAWVLANVAGGVVSSTTVMAASTANLTLSGTQTVDGIALSAGNTILVKDQTTQSGNGIYTVAAGAWTRMTAMDTWAEVPGMLVSVQQGTVNHDTVWLSTADAGGTLGTTAITFTQLPGPSDITAGAGLLRTGQVIDVVSADNSMTINADSLQVKRDPAGAITITANGLFINYDALTMIISSNLIGVRLDGARAITSTASGIGVNIDAATMAITGNALGVKSGTYLGSSNIVTRETPTGLVNGANTTYTLAATPTAGTEEVFLNGILQEPGAGNDYTISGATITYLTAPATGDRLRVNYRK
jgi:fiber protein